jgi:Uma2 family endonuclease
MSLPAERLATYEDLMAVPPPLVAEIINGRLVTHPRPAPRHAWASSLLTGRLMRPFHEGDGGPGGWIILDEPELHLDGHVLVPDLGGWRRERMPALPATAWFELAPYWVCEVLSPSTARSDRAEKMPLYAQAGVAHLWLIDPDIQTLEVYARREDGHWLLLDTLQASDEVRQPPFDAIVFNLSVLWP